MMQLYKRRDFGALVSDTFNFFKENGKNYFKTYIAINGALLILLVMLYVVGYKSIFSQAFGSNIGGHSYYFEQYFQENMPVFIGFGIVFLLIFLACTLVVYTFPVLYMRRLAQKNSTEITVNDMMLDLRKSIKKFLIFLLGMMLIMVPFTIVAMMLSAFLMVILIGFVLIFLMIPAVMNVVNFTLFDYFHTDKGFFKSLSYGFRSQFSYPDRQWKSPFWKYWGSSTVIMMVVQMVTSVVMLIPMVLMTASVLTVPDTQKGAAMGHFFNSGMGVLYFVFYGISLLISFLLMNVIYVNAGLMYYDSRTDLHRAEDFSEIDTIGQREA